MPDDSELLEGIAKIELAVHTAWSGLSDKCKSQLVSFSLQSGTGDGKVIRLDFRWGGPEEVDGLLTVNLPCASRDLLVKLAEETGQTFEETISSALRVYEDR